MEYIIAFCIGGLFCVIAQLLIDLTGITPARILVSYVVGGVVLTALGIYGPIAEFAGCGATVPLCGFGYLLANGVRLALARDGLIGILTGGLSAASAGISASLCFGFLAALIFKGRPRGSHLKKGADG